MYSRLSNEIRGEDVEFKIFNPARLFRLVFTRDQHLFPRTLKIRE